MIKTARQEAIDAVAYRPAGAGESARLASWHAGSARKSLPEWLQANDRIVRDVLHERGAVYLRGFDPLSAPEFARIVQQLCGSTIEYSERTTPRELIDPALSHVYTSTEYPADQEIFLHNENSYASRWPRHLCFYCERPAEAGGETTLADIGRVGDFIDDEVIRLIQERGLLHRRIFLEGVGVSWRTAFNVDSIEALQADCRQLGLQLLLKDDRVTVEYAHAPYARHPHSGRLCWFNHAAFFQSDKLEGRVVRSLHQMLGGDELPNRLVFADGATIPTAVIAELTRAYRKALFPHAWQGGDLLLLDNMRYAHGRRPFVGARRVWVSMVDELKRTDLLP